MPAYEPLVRTRADGSFEPALAESWSVAPDNKSVDVHPAQGRQVQRRRARQRRPRAKKSIEYWVGKKGPFSTNLATLTSIDVVDDRTVQGQPEQPAIRTFSPCSTPIG